MDDDTSHRNLLVGVGVVAGIVGLATIGYLLGPAPNKPKEKAGGGLGGLGGLGGAEGMDENTVALLQQLMAQGGAKKPGTPQGNRASTLPGPGPLTSGAAGGAPVSAYGAVTALSDTSVLEQKLQHKIQAMFSCIEADDKEGARKLGEECMEIAKQCFGPNSENVIGLAMRFSKMLTDPFFLQNIFNSLVKDESTEIRLLWTISMVLHEIYEGVETPEAVQIQNNEQLAERLLEDLEKYKEPYLMLAEQTLSFHRNLGNWKKISELVLDVRSRLAQSPLAVRSIIEQQVGSYHQEGKTEEAITYLKSYLEQIKDLPDSLSHVAWCHQRISKFEFYLDHFEATREHLLLAFEKGAKPTSEAYGVLSDLVSACVELGEFDRGVEYFKLLTHEKHVAERARSKYLLTIEAQLQKAYHLVLKVCRVRPQRKEGERDPEEADYERKLTNFFLEAQFPHPHNPDEYVTVEQAVDHFDIEVKSPAFDTAATPGTWHLVKFTLYEDGSKEKVLGHHWQPVYATPAVRSVGKPSIL